MTLHTGVCVFNDCSSFNFDAISVSNSASIAYAHVPCGLFLLAGIVERRGTESSLCFVALLLDSGHLGFGVLGDRSEAWVGESFYGLAFRGPDHACQALSDSPRESLGEPRVLSATDLPGIVLRIGLAPTEYASKVHSPLQQSSPVMKACICWSAASMKRVSSLCGKIHTLSGENAGSPIMVDDKGTHSRVRWRAHRVRLLR